MSKISILRAVRNRKTIAGEIAVAQKRAQQSAVSVEGNTIDFSANDQLVIYMAKQAELRKTKLAILAASINNKVRIPKNIEIPESGQEVPVHQAILIRDDLKGLKGLLESLIAIDTNPVRDIYAMRAGMESEGKRKVRNFDFEKTVKAVADLQGAIDEIDAAIQYVDSTSEISIQ